MDEMRISIGLPGDPSDDDLRFVKQLGCDSVVCATPKSLPGDRRWEYDDLARLRDRIESFDLRIEAIQNVPHEFWQRIRIGDPKREEDLPGMLDTIRNLGKAGIRILGQNFRPDPLYRTGTKPGRGGARVTVFEHDKARDRPLTYGSELDAEHMWESYEWWITRAIPVAEDAGVVLALHPDDPPGVDLGGVARIMSSFEGFRRASEIVDSPAWALLFCVGCWSEMGGEENVLRGIRHFAPLGKIAYVHFRDVQGTGTEFAECFIGEGNLNVTRMMRTLRECGFRGCLIDDHVPHMIGDEGWAPRGRAHATGYLMGLLRAIEDTDGSD